MRNGHRDWGWGSGDGSEREKQVSSYWTEPLRPMPACESNWLGVRGWGEEREPNISSGLRWQKPVPLDRDIPSGSKLQTKDMRLTSKENLITKGFSCPPNSCVKFVMIKIDFQRAGHRENCVVLFQLSDRVTCSLSLE